MDTPAREPQTRLLEAALRSPYAAPIFLHGPPSTAKSATLDAALPKDSTSVQVDCVLSHTDRLLFSAIVGYDIPSHPCDLVAAFAQNPPANIHTLVFNRAERLSGPNFSPAAVEALFRLPQLADAQCLRLVFISRSPWHVFRAALSCYLPNPVTIFFPPYSEPELVHLLSNAYDPHRLHTRPPPQLEARAAQFYPGYVKSVIAVLYPTTADLRELQRVCDDLYPLYIMCGKDPSASFNVVQDKLRRSLHTLYSRQIIPREKQLSSELAKRREERELLIRKDLSRTALTLLVAAFLASRNPPNHDMRYFTIERTRRSRGRGKGRPRGRGRSKSSDERTAAPMKVFSLERLLAIYAAIRVDADGYASTEKEDPGVSSALSTSCLIQISTLVALRYLAKEGGGDPLSEPKYRSNVTEEQAQDISTLLGIELHQYWHKE